MSTHAIDLRHEPSFIRWFVEIIKEIFGGVWDVAVFTAESYKAILRLYLIHSSLAYCISLGLAAIGWRFDIGILVAQNVIVSLLILTGWTVLLYPVLAPLHFLYSKLESMRAYARILAFLWFFGFGLACALNWAVYSGALKSLNGWFAVMLLIIGLAFLTAGAVIYGMGEWTKKAVFTRGFVCVGVALFFLVLPKTASAVSELPSAVDTSASRAFRWLASSVDTPPECIPVSLEDLAEHPERFMFFNPKNGQPQRWYNPDEISDGLPACIYKEKGHNPTTQTAHVPVTNPVVKSWQNIAKARLQQKRAQDAVKQREAQRQAEERRMLEEKKALENQVIREREESKHAKEQEQLRAPIEEEYEPVYASYNAASSGRAYDSAVSLQTREVVEHLAIEPTRRVDEYFAAPEIETVPRADQATSVPLIISSTISSGESHIGQSVSARLSSRTRITIEGQVYETEDCIFRGRIVDVLSSRRNGIGQIRFEIDQMIDRHGRRLNLDLQPITVSGPLHYTYAPSHPMPDRYREQLEHEEVVLLSGLKFYAKPW